MKKKKEVKSDSDPAPVVDLKALIHQHSLFFDKLVELIPARFYLPAEVDEDKVWGPKSKKEKARLKKIAKKNIKTVRRHRLDPERASMTTLDLLKQRLEKDKPEKDGIKIDDKDDEGNEKNILSGLDDDDGEEENNNNKSSSTTYEDLRERLHRRIEEFRGGRNVGCSNRELKRAERKERREEKGHLPKRKRDPEKPEKEENQKSEKDVDNEAAEAAEKLSFGFVELGDGERKRKKRKLSKQQELERAREKRDAREKDPEVAAKESWGSATSRAMGEKVHDDPKQLSKSIQKEKRRHQKNAQKWKERVQTTNKKMADKQRKRNDNIQSRKDERKQRKIDKREKKLMRPGFEGRKDGFITK